MSSTDRRGLSRTEADALLARYGPNAIAVERPSRLTILARRLWGPIPWLLEITLGLTLATHRFGDSIAIAFLLLFNAAVATWQEGRAGDALELLRSRIVVEVRVKRDGEWTTLPGDGLVPGDLVHLSVGDVVAADTRLLDGGIEVDESALTGESLPKALDAEALAYAGTVVQRGDGDATVIATGSSTKFGRTAQLVPTAKTTGTLEHLVVRLVSILSVASLVVVAVIAFAALHYRVDPVDIAVFSLMILLASVPIALPAAFTLATTLGSIDLAKQGALVTRLSAVEDAASMDVLCTDKTGTITENRVAVAECVTYEPFREDDLVALAAAASDEAQKDRIDMAVLRFARERRRHSLGRHSRNGLQGSAERAACDDCKLGAIDGRRRRAPSEVGRSRPGGRAPARAHGAARRLDRPLGSTARRCR